MAWWRMVLFLGVFGGLAAGLHVYLYRRLVRDPLRSARARRVGRWVFTGLGLLLLTGVAINRFVPRHLGEVIGYAAFGWMGLVTLLVPLLWAVDMVRIPLAVRRRARGEGPVDPTRRLAIARGAAALTTLTAGGAAAVAVDTALAGPRVEHVTVPIAGLDPALDGLVVVQLSDIHVGPTLGRPFVEGLVRTVNGLGADLVAITGDLVDGTVGRLGDHTAPLAHLRSTHGTFFCTGNHEYYSGVDAWCAELQRLGVTVLRNRHVGLTHKGAALDVVGVDDWRADHDMARACQGRDAARFGLCLAHQPKSVAAAAAHGLDLMLCGHTHGGQI
ncbi:MAG: metallophosphoesterase, partial [Myxococcales bacterium]|nr:metallophosphoesterase [Myxococcales bacterium]